MKWSKRTKILVALLFIFIIAQALRPAKNDGVADGPKDITKIVTVPDSVLLVLKKSCYDCHSNHSDYPWYDRVTPVNFWVSNHITEGKSKLNFSVFSDYPLKKMTKRLDEISETVEKKKCL